MLHGHIVKNGQQQLEHMVELNVDWLIYTIDISSQFCL